MAQASILVPVTEPSQVGEARRAAAGLVRRLGFGETEAGKVGVVVTEAANNLVKHAGGGEIVLRELVERPEGGIEVLSIDKGPGMVDPAKCLRDGYSSAGTPGTGLGAISRFSLDFDLFSFPGGGTVLVSQVSAQQLHEPPRFDFKLGAVCLPMPAQDRCGDAWDVQRVKGGVRVVAADGLGHGPQAEAASQMAVRICRENRERPPADCLREAHAALRATRGAAVAIAEVDFQNKMVRFAGAGNISASIQGYGPVQNLVSHNGTVGLEMRNVQEFTYGWDSRSVLILHSDGLNTRWTLEQYPGLITRHPAIIAGTLYRDFRRGRDDVLVVAVAEEGA